MTLMEYGFRQVKSSFVMTVNFISGGLERY